MGKNYDLFVSYAHIDNQDGWASTIVKKLKMTLQIHMGRDDINVFFDPSLNPNDSLDGILDKVRSSSLFLAIGSPAFVQREFTRLELSTFYEETHDHSRIFLVERRPLLDGLTYPNEVADHIRERLYSRNEETGIDCEHPLDSDRLNQHLQKLAASISRKLIEVSQSPKGGGRLVSKGPLPGLNLAMQTARPSPSDMESKTVLLAQTTEAMDEELQQVRAYLEQLGIVVLPEREYPQGASEFRAAFLLDLNRCDMFVQLLDQRRGRCPPDMKEGYLQFQADAAREHGLEIMQWRDQRINLEEIEEGFRELLERETVMACGLEEFKQAMRKQAMKQVRTDRAPNRVVVAINADQCDLAIAERINELCSEYQLVSILPFDDPEKKADTQEDMRTTLEDSDAYIYLYGNAKVDWVRAQLKFFIKYSRNRNKRLLICTPPPEDKPKLNIFIPGAIEITGDHEEIMQRLTEQLAELAA